jgi:hypothetical protein
LKKNEIENDIVKIIKSMDIEDDIITLHTIIMEKLAFITTNNI